MCEFHDCNGNGFGDMWWTDKCTYFSSIDIKLQNECAEKSAIYPMQQCSLLAIMRKLRLPFFVFSQSGCRKFAAVASSYLLALPRMLCMHTLPGTQPSVFSFRGFVETLSVLPSLRKSMLPLLSVRGPFGMYNCLFRGQYGIYLPVNYRRIKSLLFLDGTPFWDFFAT